MFDFTLYNYFRSSSSFRVRIALQLKNLNYEYRAIHLVKNEQYQGEYQELNPSSEVPTLVHQGQAIGQSMAILEYLDVVAPKPRLFPVDSMKAAKVRQFCETINSGIQGYQNLKTLKYLETHFHVSTEAKQQWLNFWIQTGFRSLEEQIHQTAGRFCFGDEVTAAECLLVPQVFAAQRFQVSLEEFSVCRRIAEACEGLEPFQKAHPFRQPDTPGEFRVC
ncbi:MAG: maleylacetoacetate isomerase [Bdellovibrio sp.]|nr:MAG: maleylacetoacetate isomerase [Bdellovibrio sp.]